MSLADTDWAGDDSSLLITAEDEHALLQLDLKSGTVSQRLDLGVPLTGSTVSTDGKRIYTTGGGSEGRVFVIDADTNAVVQTIPVGHSPNAPVLSPDGTRLYVSNQFDNDLSVIELPSGKVLSRVPVIREPVAADITPDGRTLFVANLIPFGRADVDYIAAAISVIDTETLQVSQIPLLNGAEGLRGLKVSPDGQYAFATHILARFQVPTTQLERGWVATNALSVIRVSDQKLIHTVLLDDINLGFPNPWSIGFSEDGNSIIVASAGNHELSLIDLPAMLEKIQEQAADSSVEEQSNLYVHNDLSFLSGIRKRIALNGKGPRSLVVKGQLAYVSHYFSDSVDVVDFNNPRSISIESYELNPGLEFTQERLGELFFHDASLCFQKWLSCSSCHPDARTDGLNWDLLNDGIANPKNVKSMLYAHRTPPTTWLGVRANAEVSVRAGIKHIQFAVRPESDAEALDAYLKSLRPEPSPHLVNGELSESALRGKRLFQTQRCVRCHEGELYTDMQQHMVGTTKGVDTGKPVDTPSLIELWRTAPYLHDGRAATVRDVLTAEAHAGIIERTKRLNDEELADLEAFLLSL
ncbi:MAG: c-type cytochrome [Coraliomargarita sp.]